MDISHIVVRDQSYVAGTADKPEVGVFVQTNRKSKAIDDNKLAVGQTVWMKWSGGPIVASSKILSWHTGNFQSGNINQIRELCIGTNLFGLANYWYQVSGKIDGYYAVILLSEEHWLEQPIFTAARSYGSSWIYLDTVEKSDMWLTNDVLQQEKDNNPKGRSIPKGMRFDVLKRDNFTCQYCGGKAPEVSLHVDHKIPWKIVQKHEVENLVTACSVCNLGKSDNPIEDMRPLESLPHKLDAQSKNQAIKDMFLNEFPPSALIRHHKDFESFRDMAALYGVTRTGANAPDGVDFWDDELDIPEINKFIENLQAEIGRTWE